MNVYCANKFNYLKIDVEKRLLYNCHEAYPHNITSDWLEQNPGKIFNTELMLEERKQMLAGIKNKSCYYKCYKTEDNGDVSLRQIVMQYKKPFYNSAESEVETLDVMLNTDCNLSCVYCGGMFSSTWRREIKKHGLYDNLEKNWNDIYDKMSQKEKSKSRFMELFLNEITLMKKLKRVSITGGEPLLSNNLLDLIAVCPQDAQIEIITGLGISESRFLSMLDKMAHLKNLVFCVSGESLGNFYNFNRYNNTFDKFAKFIEILKERNIKVQHIATVTNLTLFGLHDFYKRYNESQVEYGVHVHPKFLQKHIIDENSKDIVFDQWSGSNDDFGRYVLQGLERKATELERKQLSLYLKQISQRRSLSYDIFPKTFLNWLEL